MATGSYSDAFGGGGWKGYGAYLDQKNTRINQQLKERHNNTNEGQSDPSSSLFSDCVFWLDGRTRIPEYKLKALMVKHGGNYESYDLSKVRRLTTSYLFSP